MKPLEISDLDFDTITLKEVYGVEAVPHVNVAVRQDNDYRAVVLTYDKLQTVRDWITEWLLERGVAQPQHGLAISVDDPIYPDLIPLMAPRAPGWGHVRAEHLLDHPECAACGTRSDLEVHHVFPFHLWPMFELDPRNLITFCGPHHLLIGHLMSWRAYNPHCRRDAARWKTDIRARLTEARWTPQEVEAMLGAAA